MHILAHAAHLHAQCEQVNCTGVLLHRGMGRIPVLKPEQSAHLVCTNVQLDAGQDFRSLTPRNFIWCVRGGGQLDFWGLFVSGYFSFGLGIMGFGEGKFT